VHGDSTHPLLLFVGAFGGRSPLVACILICLWVFFIYRRPFLQLGITSPGISSPGRHQLTVRAEDAEEPKGLLGLKIVADHDTESAITVDELLYPTNWDMVVKVDFLMLPSSSSFFYISTSHTEMHNGTKLFKN
jgi:hypothetical protein